MEQIMGELLKVVIATIVSGVVLYVGIVNKLRSQMLLHDKQIAQPAWPSWRSASATSRLRAVLYQNL